MLEEEIELSVTLDGLLELELFTLLSLLSELNVLWLELLSVLELLKVD